MLTRETLRKRVEEKWVNSTTAPKTVKVCFPEKINVEEENTVK
jgi:hypothetical protein